MLAVKLAQKETVFAMICFASWHHKSSFVSEGIFTVIFFLEADCVIYDRGCLSLCDRVSL